MSESHKKNKKTKKKSNSAQGVSVSTETKNSSNTVNNIKDILPTLNIKTPDDIKITLVENSVQDIADKTQSVPANKNVSNGEEAVATDKRKKKKSKKKSKEEAEGTVIENNPSNPSFLNFSENGIHLKNHPEISVTYTNEQPKVTETEIVKKQIPPAEEQNDNTLNNSSKKKKKKKKKGNINVPETPKNETPPTETTYTAPTYTRVVTSDNTTVLVVNNENLAAASKSFTNMDDKNKSAEGKVNVKLIASEGNPGNVLITKKMSSDSSTQLSNSVGIFPVLTNVSDKTSIVNSISQPSLDTISNILKKSNSNIPTEENIEGTETTKAQLKAERRAKQEAQRAAKLAAKGNNKPDSENVAQNKNTKPPKEASSFKTPNDNNCKPSVEKTGRDIEKDQLRKSSDKDSLRKVRLFSHLPHSKQLNLNAKVHPAILEVGYQYNKGIICGSNARCVALLAALREIIQEYKPQPEKNMCRELETGIQTYLSYLNNCRPLSVSMVNAVKFLKHQMNHISSEMEVNKTKEVLSKFIDDFVNEEILLAKEAIGNSASAKIVDCDVILVFAHSSLVKHVLYKACNENKVFRVIVADSRPKLEGLQMLRCLVKQGLQCSYISINAVSYVMKEVSKVIIGAHALLSNGCVMSRLGSKQIALVASSYSVPVLVCCETYKFCERVLTDSFVHNELGEPEEIVAKTFVLKDSLKESQDMSSLQLLNLLYDVTPPDLISMVITEKGVLPCTSVPVVLRVRYAGLHE